MGPIRRLVPLGAGAAAVVLLASCGVFMDEAAEAEPAEEALVLGRGVTAAPCPDTHDEDNGCIYLGVLTDMTEGPFADLGVPITEGQRAFWRHVNEQGGIAGFDVDIDTYSRDTRYDPERHREAYDEIEPEVLALAQSLGTATTTSILDRLDADDMVVAGASWWSGWRHDDADHGLVLESGYTYCTEAMLALDWFAQDRSMPASVMSIGFDSYYGRDLAAGAEHWAEANEVAWLGAVVTEPNQVVGSQDAVIPQLLTAEADVVLLGVGPPEAVDIVSGAVASDFQGQFLGSVHTWSPAMLDTAVGPELPYYYVNLAPWEGYGGDSEAHDAMRGARLDGLPANDGYAHGWVWSYPLLAAIEAAVESGELTRASLRAAVDGLEVDYQGALAPRVYGAEEQAPDGPQAVISVPDDGEALGLRSIVTDFTGPTAAAHDLREPCTG